MTDRADDLDRVAVVCPVCNTRTDGPVDDEPGEVECPDCFTVIRVPSREEVLANRPPERKLEDPGTYQLATDDDAPRRPAASTAQNEYATIKCPQCSGHLTPELRDRAWNMTCPDCLEVVEVLAREAWAKKQRRKAKRRASTVVGYGISEPSAPSTEASTEKREPTTTRDIFDVQAEIRREPKQPIPRWTFFTGVFELPFRRDVRTQWLYLSIGCSVLGFLLAIVLWLAFVQNFFFGVPFFALPAIWVGIWTGSYAGSCFLTVVEDTANGIDRIANWNDGGWRDWAAETLGLLFHGLLVASIAFLTGRAAETAFGEIAFWPAVGVTFCLGFPFVVLSSMQAGSVWSPFSIPVLQTTCRKAWVWLVYFALAAVVGAAYLFPLRAGLSAGSYFLTLMATGPLLGAVVFVQARLLGRLVWRVLIFDAGTELPGKRKRRQGKHNSKARPDDERQSANRVSSLA